MYRLMLTKLKLMTCYNEFYCCLIYAIISYYKMEILFIMKDNHLQGLLQMKKIYNTISPESYILKIVCCAATTLPLLM